MITIRERVLKSLGYQVSTFGSSIEALTAFREAPLRYDLVLTDMTMPDMDGKELTENILALRPDTPIILCTGYSDLINEQKTREYGIRAFLSKPVNQQTLAQTVRMVLDAEKKSPAKQQEQLH